MAPVRSVLARLRNRGGLFAVDQVVSSVSNFLVVFLVARADSRAAFGAFAVSYGIVIFTLGLRNSVLGDLVLVDRAAGSRPEALGAGVSLYLGCASAAAAVIAGVVLDLPTSELVGFALTPAILLEDAIRTAAFVGRRPDQALRVDSLWLAVQLVLTFALGPSDGGSVVLSWVIGAVVSSAWGWRLASPTLSPRRCLVWLGERGDLAGPYALQYACTTGVTQLLGLFVASVGPVRDAGALRGGQTLLGPYNVCLMASRLDLLTRLRHDAGAAEMHRAYRRSAAVLTLVAAAIVAIVMTLPTSIGVHILGPTWSAAADVAPFIVLEMWFVGLAQPAQVRLTAGLQSRASLVTKALAGATAILVLAALAIAGVSALRCAIAALIASAFVNLTATSIAARRLTPVVAVTSE